MLLSSFQPFANGGGSALAASFRLDDANWANVTATLPGASESWTRLRGAIDGHGCASAVGAAPKWTATSNLDWHFTATVTCDDALSALLGQTATLEADGHTTN
jgi:hypothetical protein